MFIRASRSGGHTYLRLVESFRDQAGRTRQRQIAQLGRADQLSDEQVDTLISSLRRATGRAEPPTPGSAQFEPAREVGSPWVLTELWRALGFDRSVARALRSGRRRFDAEAFTRVSIFAGTSTGLNVVAALQLAEEIGQGGVVVTAACDTGFKYLDGALYRDEAQPADTSATGPTTRPQC